MSEGRANLSASLKAFRCYRRTREVLSKEKHLSSKSSQCSGGDRTHPRNSTSLVTDGEVQGQRDRAYGPSPRKQSRASKGGWAERVGGGMRGRDS